MSVTSLNVSQIIMEVSFSGYFREIKPHHFDKPLDGKSTLYIDVMYINLDDFILSVHVGHEIQWFFVTLFSV